jgi:hypothetical protein
MKLQHSRRKTVTHKGIAGLDVDPIPLTPEILEKCGFVNAYSQFHDGRFIYNLKTLPEIHFQWDSDYDAIIVSKAENDPMMCGCASLHQLQNLYFALTRTELNYSPDNKINP